LEPPLRARGDLGVNRMFPKMVRRDVIVLLCIKVMALTLIYYFLVAPVSKPEPNGQAMAAHLIGG
jgi:hypothetical protein